MASRYWPGEDPVGKRVVFPWIEGQVEIVGVAENENTGSLDTEVQPVVYFPYSQTLEGGWCTVVRTSGRATTFMSSAASATLRAIGPATRPM